jgi:hypothetical protein
MFSGMMAAIYRRGFSTPATPPPWWCHRTSGPWSVTRQRKRGHEKGIWGLPDYQPIPAEKLPGSTRGFRLVTGRVQRIGESRANLWLNLSRHMAVRIPKSDLVYE